MPPYSHRLKRSGLFGAQFGARLDNNQQKGLSAKAERPVVVQVLKDGRYWDRTSDNLLVREVLYR